MVSDEHLGCHIGCRMLRAQNDTLFMSGMQHDTRCVGALMTLI